MKQVKYGPKIASTYSHSCTSMKTRIETGTSSIVTIILIFLTVVLP
ncbi:Uncharacterized protein dnl_30670 [Desulfonema limicola]|uniref:Uncharacterized protein n=1 Tax=Desulfonema limicola TaxID=45656 RepID=A0A975B8J0_9BACT|nr:Uncharacterized protein dnl_30670 [Desulfonema limicola]